MLLSFQTGILYVMSGTSPKAFPFKVLLKNLVWGGGQLWRICPFLMLMMALTALFESVLPASLALATRYLINRVSELIGNGPQQINAVLTPLLLTLALIILQNVSTAIKFYLGQIFIDVVNLKVSHQVMTHASMHDVSFFENSNNQNMLARVNEHTAHHLCRCYINVLALLADLLKLCSLSMILILIEPLFAVVIVPLFIPYLFFKIRLAKDRYTIHHSQTLKRRWTNYFVGLLLKPQQVAEIRLLGIATFFIEKFKTLMDEFNAQEKGLYKRNFIGNLIFSTIANLVIFLLLSKIIIRAIAGALSIGDVVIFISTSANLRNLLENTTTALSSIHEHSSNIGNYRDFLHLSILTQDKQNKLPITLTNGTVELKNVCFTYAGSKEPVLHNISLKINPGETIALVGENAAGKTTLAKLIAGLYKADSGTITIDGQDIQLCSQEDLQKKIAFVFQNFGKFEASVSDNIAVGDWRRLIGDEEQVEKIAQRVNLHHFIKNYPDGYQTKLGRQFGKYDPSGGQWQDIAIARAFAKDPVLLILDEPTANLDVQSEYDLFLRFKELAAGRTTILISHRFSTVKIADRIIVLSEKGVVENGTHKELIKNDAAYAAMFKVYQNQMDFEHVN